MDSDVRKSLAHSLGFLNYPSNDLASPYLKYIEAQHYNPDTVEEYLEFFTQVVTDLSAESSTPPSIKAYIDGIIQNQNALFSGTRPEEHRRELVTDTILNIIGVWIISRAYFAKSSGYRPVEAAYKLWQMESGSGSSIALNESLPSLIRHSGLIPSQDLSITNTANLTLPRLIETDIHHLQSSRLDSLEAGVIKSTKLNAYTLFSLADTRISWTFNFSRHLLLTSFGGQNTLEVFALPCALRGKALSKAGIPYTFIHEIQSSYSILFDPYGARQPHSRLIKAIGLDRWCWCRSCVTRRFKASELKTLAAQLSLRKQFDPLLVELMSSPHEQNWDHELFMHLWPRISALEEHLQSAKPWNFWVLFRDRRDTLQFWTFLFGTLILFLTVLQVALGAAQVAGSF